MTVRRVQEAYAINIADLLYTDLQVLGWTLLGPVTPSRTIVHTDPKTMESGAVVLEVPPTRARAICDLVSRAASTRGRIVRCYRQGPRGGWSPLPRPKKATA